MRFFGGSFTLAIAALALALASAVSPAAAEEPPPPAAPAKGAKHHDGGPSKHKSGIPLDPSEAERLHIKGLVASFTTRYPCCQSRVANIHRAAALLDGAIVKPGQRFSLNHRLGKRTEKRGFIPAPTIEEGEMVRTPGGGVSQLATTLYNAVFDAGYAIVSRKPHSFHFPRYPMGVEATLSWPRPDFVFRNDSDAAVLIRVSTTDESVTVKLYGDVGGRKVKRFVSAPSAFTDPPVDYEPDEGLKLDEQKVKEQGVKGWSVVSGRDITFPNGRIKHEEKKTRYRARPRVIVAHPCSIPKGERGHRSKGCPKPQAPDDDVHALGKTGDGALDAPRDGRKPPIDEPKKKKTSRKKRR